MSEVELGGDGDRVPRWERFGGVIAADVDRRPGGTREAIPDGQHRGEDESVDRVPKFHPSVRSLAQRSSRLSREQIEGIADRAARFHISVLILGDTGVGKEVLARRVHLQSPRAEQPMVCVDCASLCATLIESELFGHERGSFTGAVQSRSGLLEIANGGTVFLDEVGELPLTVQAKLLRVLDTRTIQRVGSAKPRTIDVRFVAATNRDLDRDVLEGRFRADLLFRLDGIRLAIPPLRERTRDVPGLAREFLTEAGAREGIRTPGLSDRAIEELMEYSWPGNVRQLRNVIDRALVLCDGQQIEPQHLFLDGSVPSDGASLGPGPGDATAWASGRSEKTTSQRIASADSGARRETIVSALAICAGNQTRAARLLGISRRSLLTQLDILGIPRPRKPLPSGRRLASGSRPLVLVPGP